MNDATCKTCIYWRVFPENDLAGHCTKLGLSIWPKVQSIDELIKPATYSQDMRLMADMAITEAEFSSVLGVRTKRDFGCKFHVGPKE